MAQKNKVIIADLRLTPEAEAFVKEHEASKIVIFTKCNVAVWKEMQNLITVSQKEFGDVPDVYIAGAGVFEKVQCQLTLSKPSYNELSKCLARSILL